MQKVPLDVEHLREWFLSEKRDFPWRSIEDPYAVWISETMLQQTRALVVKPFYLNWMARFPTIQALAVAPLEEVIKQWEGLGYYSRARHLHEAAGYLVSYHNGKLPSTHQELSKIKGIGPYTAGAILSFGFKKKAAAVDGNVIRVLARYFAVQEDVRLSKTIQKIWKLAEEFLPDQAPWEIVEALIELGATLCGRRPRCFDCPLRGGCQAFKLGIQEVLPYKSTSVKISLLTRQVFVIYSQGHLLLKKGEKGKVMADLYQFCYSEGARTEFPFLFEAKQISSLRQVTHSFTRYKALLFPSIWEAKEIAPVSGFTWVLLGQARRLPFSAGHRKIMDTAVEFLTKLD